MRNMLVIFSTIIVFLLAIQAGHAAVEPVYLSLNAHSDENNSVRVLKILNDEFYIGVKGSESFSLEPVTSYPIDAEQIVIVTSEGKLLEPVDGLVSYRCDYLVSYWGMVVAKYADGHIECFPFRLGPAWSSADDLIDSFPEIARPISDDEDIDKVIRQWWDETVVPADDIWRREFFKMEGESDDNKQ